MRHEYAAYANRTLAFDGLTIVLSETGANLAPAVASGFGSGVPETGSDFPKPGAVLLGSFGGRFELAERLGEGGSGVVHACTRLGDSGRRLAIKVFSPSEPSTSKAKRFKNEVRLCLRLHHPNVIEIVDFNVLLEKGPTFFVMPYYPWTLRKAIKAGIAPQDVLPLFGRILNGLDAAHRKGVWHRDIKPENILLEADLKDAVVADFGIAHIHEELLHTKVETNARERLANVHYAAPEQRVRGAKVDHRADIYALGLILHEMFTGTVPLGVGYPPVAERYSKYGFVDSVVSKMMQHDPGNRFDSLQEVADALELDHLGAGVLATRTGEMKPVRTESRLRSAIASGWQGARRLFLREPRART